MHPKETEGAPTLVLVLTASEADDSVVSRLLRSDGLEPRICSGIEALTVELGDGDAGAVLLAEEALGERALELLTDTLADQPEWSDLPLILLATAGRDPGQTIDRFWRIAESRVSVLERPVRSRTLLAATRAALRSRRHQLRIRDELERRSAFLATLAHELRNPLAPLQTGVEVLRKSRDPETRSESLDVLERQSDRLARLIDDLLDITRVAHGRLQLRRERVKLDEIVRGALEATAPLVAEAGHELVVDLPDAPIVLDADPLRIEQVLINLLSNAVKYTPAGGRIDVGVESRGADEDRTVRISIRDDGIGIPPERIEGLFGMFQQGGPGPGTGEGLGIGLALARSLTEMHGGRLLASSPGRNRGSLFQVILPVAETVTPEPGRDPMIPDRPTPRTRLRVLVADDNRDAARLLVHLIDLLGHEATLAYDGAEALEQIRARTPDLVLLDIGMPGLNGYEVARRVRSSEPGHRIVLVALTGWDQDRDREESAAAGFDHHLTKPLRPEDLSSLLAGISDRDDATFDAGRPNEATGAGDSGRDDGAVRDETEAPGPATDSANGGLRSPGRRLVHDLRGDINGLVLTLRLLRGKTGEREELRTLVERAEKSVESLARSLDQLSKRVP